MMVRTHRWLQYRRRPALYILPSRRNWRCMRLCCGGLRRLARLASAGWRQRRTAQAHCKTPIEQRIPVVANIPIRARLSHPTAPNDVCDHDERRIPAIASATPRYASASAAAETMLPSSFVVTPDQEHREAGSRADNHRAKSEENVIPMKSRSTRTETIGLATAESDDRQQRHRRDDRGSKDDQQEDQ